VAALVVAIAACGESQTPPAKREAAPDFPAAGLWNKAEGEAPGALTPIQQQEIAALEALGYVDGSTAAPESVGVTTALPDRVAPGLNLIVSAHAPQATLMDAAGRVLHRWSVDFEALWGVPPTEKNRYQQYWRRAQLLPEGDLVAIHEGFGMVRLDRDSNVRWAKRNYAHHDVFVAPNGDLVTLTRTHHLVPRIHAERPIAEDFVVVLGPDGNEKRRTSILEALERSRFAHYLEQRAPAGDIFHTNTVEILDGRHAAHSPAFAAGNALVSIRNLDLLAILDLDAEEVVWALRGEWRQQHQPTFLASGNLLLFDNQGRDGKSQVLELDPLTGEIVWSYPADEAPLYSQLSGSSQRLPNGNTLITESDRGRAFEVTPEGVVAWEWVSPYRAGDERQYVATLFEVVRVPEEEVGGWLEPAPGAGVASATVDAEATP